MTTFVVLALEHGLVPNSLSRGNVTRRLVDLLSAVGFTASGYQMGRWGWVTNLGPDRCGLCRTSTGVGASIIGVPRSPEDDDGPRQWFLCAECIAKGV